MAAQKPAPDNRRESMNRKMGAEGKSITKGSHKGHSIAVFTSGGDAQGEWSHDLYTILALCVCTCVCVEYIQGFYCWPWLWNSPLANVCPVKSVLAF